MPRVAADHGTYRAYLRCRKRDEGACTACVEAKRDRAAKVSKSSASRIAAAAGAVAAPTEPPQVPVGDAPLTEEGHISRLEVLKELLQEQRELVPVLKQKDPARAYLLMRDLKDTMRQIAEIQGNGQVKGVTLADQLAEARARREAGAKAAADPGARGVAG
ncbi:hypothetical protein IC744_06780 [Microbacterium hominis]|uniref:hypothetical protein n=1 Tax=Microbacterium TaxID=33882 RepID=UPI00168B94D5|nr:MULTISPECIES: hypothetical protein [Microbacterium]QOC26054.1 hypothetical protein IC745_01100 [Microbacterium hominis]QOC30025.1 hypothetical protein IC744_06780 [Microbacterium hominis]QYF98462.1 hypothetical protein KY498_04245 [Microbacterium sp. PAMC21962]